MHQRQFYQTGLTFIEILVALAILSVALLGLLSGLTTALQHTQAAYHASLATQYLRNHTTQLRLSVAQPLADASSLLPMGESEVHINDDVFTISVQWQTSHATPIMQFYWHNPRK